MAGPTLKRVPKTLKLSAERETTLQLNVALDDMETLRAAVAATQTLVNQLRRQQLYNVFGNPGFVIVSNFDVKNGTAFYYTNNGTLKTLAVDQTWDTGTTKTIATTQWSSALLTITAGASRVLTWAASEYASEALAIAALPAMPNATDTVVGYITVQAAGSTWTAGTDALATGTGGTPANATNYYNSVNGNDAQVGAALTTTTVDLASDLLASKVGNLQGVTT